MKHAPPQRDEAPALERPAERRRHSTRPGALSYRSCARRCRVLLSATSIAVGSSACGLTADFSGLQGGDAAPASGYTPCDGGCGGEPEDGGGDQLDASGVLVGDGADESIASGASCPTSVTSCPIQVTKDTFDTSYDGYITYLNTGMGSEIDPTVKFTVPNGVSLFTVGCSGPVGFQDQAVPSGITSLSCSQSGTTIIYAFTGTMPAGSEIALYYTTNLPSETVATCVTVTATSCP
jgi:hypothetical protein